MNRLYQAVSLIIIASVAALSAVNADDIKPPKYRRGDMKRPRPPVVEPGTASTPGAAGLPPQDAVILFNGKDLSSWKPASRAKAAEGTVKWVVTQDFFEIAPRTGAIETIEKFADAQVHIEWATPAEVKGNGQGRGNSGLYLGQFGEVQILDSFNNDTYPDGQAAALYGKFPPRVNASRKPGDWQSFDIIAEIAKLDAEGKITRPARLTVLHNGILVHHAVEFSAKIGPYSLLLQDHGNPVRFRNIWVRKLRDYDQPENVEPTKSLK